jgi:CheY-like chemotaxis protein
MGGNILHRKILIIENSNQVRLELKLVLERYGFEVIELKQAEEIFNFPMRYKGIGLIILDTNLSGMNGIAVLEHLGRDPMLSDIPVVVLGSAIPDIVRSALKAGAIDYIVKPFSPETVYERISRIINPLRTPLSNGSIDLQGLVEIEKAINHAKRGHEIFSILKLKRVLVDSPENVPQMLIMRDAIAAVLRNIDVVLFDDERNFLLILPFTDATGIVTVLEKINTLAFAGNVSKMSYTTVSYPADGSTEEVLLKVLGSKEWIEYDFRKPKSSTD